MTPLKVCSRINRIIMSLTTWMKKCVVWREMLWDFLEEDKVEWFETLKMAPLMPLASFRYSSSLVLNLSQIISLIMAL